MTKLIIISFEDFPSFTGLFNRLKAELYALRNTEIEIEIYAPKISRMGEKLYIVKNGDKKVKVKRLPIFLPKAILKRIYRNPFIKALTLIPFLILTSIKLIFDQLKREKKETLIFQIENFIVTPFIYIPAKLLKAKIFADDINFFYIRRKGLLRHLLYILEYASISRADIISTASEISMKILKKLGFTNTIYIQNTLTYDKIQDLKKCVKKIKGILETKEIEMIFIGNFTFYQNIKALEQLRELISKMTKEIKDTKIKINVIGSNIAMLPEKLLKDPLVKKGTIKIYGDAPEELKKEIFSKSLIGILPFFKDIPRWGGQMYKALEMLANCLIVVSGNEGIRGILGRPKIHYVIVKDVNEMMETIHKIYKYPHRYSSLPMNAIKLIRNNYSIDAIKNKILITIKILKKISE